MCKRFKVVCGETRRPTRKRKIHMKWLLLSRKREKNPRNLNVKSGGSSGLFQLGLCYWKTRNFFQRQANCPPHPPRCRLRCSSHSDILGLIWKLRQTERPLWPSGRCQCLSHEAARVAEGPLRFPRLLFTYSAHLVPGWLPACSKTRAE